MSLPNYDHPNEQLPATSLADDLNEIITYYSSSPITLIRVGESRTGSVGYYWPVYIDGDNQFISLTHLNIKSFPTSYHRPSRKWVWEFDESFEREKSKRQIKEQVYNILEKILAAKNFSEENLRIVIY